MQLSDFIGHNITMVIPTIHKTAMQNVKLLGVEIGGVWVESPALTNLALRRIGQQNTPKTIVFFLPYHAISVALSSIEKPS